MPFPHPQSHSIVLVMHCLYHYSPLFAPFLACVVPPFGALAVRVRAVRSRAGRVVYLCSARLHRVALEDVTDPTSIVDPGDLTHSQSHTITLACLYAYAYNAVLRAPSMHPNVHVCACALPWIWKCLSIKNGWPKPLLG